jgi:NADH-quinone oxidoreductase subunit F
VDLRIGAAAEATDEEQAAVAAVLGPPETGWDGGQRTEADGHVAYGGHAVRGRRHLLLPALHAVQERIGWISPAALDHICARLTVPPAEAYGVASFYALFRTRPAPPTVVHVCDDLACRVRGAERICAEMERRFGPEGAALSGAVRSRVRGDDPARRSGSGPDGAGPLRSRAGAADTHPGRSGRAARSARPAGEHR